MTQSHTTTLARLADDMLLTLGLTGMDQATEIALKTAFADINDRIGHWRLTAEHEADYIVVDMDSMYGPMSWLRLHAAGKLVIGLTAAPRTQADYRLARPFDTRQLAQLLSEIAQAKGLLPAAPAASVGTSPPDAGRSFSSALPPSFDIPETLLIDEEADASALDVSVAEPPSLSEDWMFPPPESQTSASLDPASLRDPAVGYAAAAIGAEFVASAPLEAFNEIPVGNSFSSSYATEPEPAQDPIPAPVPELAPPAPEPTPTPPPALADPLPELQSSSIPSGSTPSGSTPSGSEPSGSEPSGSAPFGSAPFEPDWSPQASSDTVPPDANSTVAEAFAPPQDFEFEEEPPSSGPRTTFFAHWLRPGALNGRARYQSGNGPALWIDFAQRQYFGPSGLKVLGEYFVAPVGLRDFEDIDERAWQQETAKLGAAQPLSRLQWFGGLLAGEGRLLSGYDPEGRYLLNKWPQTEREFPRHFRIATAMMKGPATLGEIASASGVPEADIADFINANLATGFAEAVSDAPASAEPARPAKPGSLFDRLRGR